MIFIIIILPLEFVIIIALMEPAVYKDDEKQYTTSEYPLQSNDIIRSQENETDTEDVMLAKDNKEHHQAHCACREA